MGFDNNLNNSVHTYETVTDPLTHDQHILPQVHLNPPSHKLH